MYLATFNGSGGSLLSFGKSSHPLSDIQVKKRVKWPNAICIEITENQFTEIDMGGTATESGGVVTVTGALSPYKAEVKKKLKRNGRTHALSIWDKDNQSNVNGGIEFGNTTLARKNAFINNMKTEWNIVKTAINKAADKAAVDAAVAAVNWPTTPTP